MKFLFTAITLICSLNLYLSAFGQLQLREFLFETTSFDMRCIGTADLNGDQLPDLLFADSWLENLGEGEWGSRVYWDPAYVVESLASGDIDNDGDTDLFVSCDLPGQTLIYLFRNQGLGDFEISFCTEGQVLETVDLNGDDRLDLLFELDDQYYSFESTNNFYSDATEKFLVDAPGSFNSPVVYATGDFNSDGTTDLAYLQSEAIHMGSNTGEEWSDFPFPPFFEEQVTDFRCADMNQDGFLDFVIIGNFGLVSYWMSDGQGMFEKQTAELGSAVSLEILDINGDQLPDVLTAFPAGVLQLYLNEGQSAFSQKPSFRVDPNALVVVAENLSGGISQQLVQSSISLQQLGAISFENQEWQQDLLHATPIVNVTGIITTDLDGDGDHDVLVASQSNSFLTAFLNEEESMSEAIVMEDQILLPSEIQKGNLIGDAKEEILVGFADIEGAGIMLMEQQAALQYSKKPLFYLVGDVAAPSQITIANINDDSHADIAFVRNDRMYFAYSDGEGNFSQPEELQLEPVPGTKKIKCYRFQDYDQDGDQDFLFSFDGLSSVHLLRNNAGFSLADIEAIYFGAASVFDFYDFNQDGDMELVLGSNLNGYLLQKVDDEYVIDGTFNIETTVDRFRFLDLDADGIFDVFSNNFSLLMREDMSFEQLIPTQVLMYRYADFFDMDGDEKVDLVARMSNGDIAVLNFESGVANQNLSASGLEMYPNPTNQGCYIRAGESGALAAYQIIDQNGRQVVSSAINQDKAQYVDTSNLESGIYFLVATYESGRYEHRRFVVAR